MFEVAVIGGRATHEENWFADITSLLNATKVFSAVELCNGQDTTADLIALRRHDRYWLSPIFVDDLTPSSQALGDGLRPTDLAPFIAQWQRLNKPLRIREFTTLEARLCAYLWMRPDALLQAVPAVHAPELYQYPLLEALAGEQSIKPQATLQLLQQQHLLESDELVDRTRHCLGCGSGHLNYVELCPSCHSLDVELESALHCFACGHVDTQESFQRHGKLSCPNCNAALKHIGVDYDRPLENHRCGSCNVFFVEGQIVARCMRCGENNAPDKLKQQRISHYRLAEQGKRYAQTGELDRRLSLSVGDAVDRNTLHWFIGWAGRLAQRHQLTSSVMALHFPNLDAMAQAGTLDVVSLRNRLTEAFRQTDVCCQYYQDLLIMVLPRTPPEHADVIRNKLTELLSSLEQGEDELELVLTVQALPADNDLDAALFLADLISSVVQP